MRVSSHGIGSASPGVCGQQRAAAAALWPLQDHLFQLKAPQSWGGDLSDCVLDSVRLEKSSVLSAAGKWRR